MKKPPQKPQTPQSECLGSSCLLMWPTRLCPCHPGGRPGLSWELSASAWQALGASASRLGTFLSFSVPLPQKQIKELTTSAGTNTRCSSPFSMTTNKTLTFESDPGLARPGSAHVEFNPLNQTWPGLGMGPIRFYQ